MCKCIWPTNLRVDWFGRGVLVWNRCSCPKGGRRVLHDGLAVMCWMYHAYASGMEGHKTPKTSRVCTKMRQTLPAQNVSVCLCPPTPQADHRVHHLMRSSCRFEIPAGCCGMETESPPRRQHHHVVFQPHPRPLPVRRCHRTGVRPVASFLSEASFPFL